MEFIGNLKQLVGERSGDGQNGPWRINQYLLETVDMYPKRMVVEVRKDIEKWDSLIGKNVIVYFSVDAHEWNGKWYNQLNGFSVIENTEEEQKRRAARRMPKPTGEIVNSQEPKDEQQDPPEQKEVDWDAMGQQAQAQPAPNGTGTAAMQGHLGKVLQEKGMDVMPSDAEKDDDLPF